MPSTFYGLNPVIYQHRIRLTTKLFVQFTESVNRKYKGNQQWLKKCQHGKLGKAPNSA